MSALSTYQKIIRANERSAKSLTLNAKDIHLLANDTAIKTAAWNDDQADGLEAEQEFEAKEFYGKD